MVAADTEMRPLGSGRLRVLSSINELEELDDKASSKHTDASIDLAVKNIVDGAS